MLSNAKISPLTQCIIKEYALNCGDPKIPQEILSPAQKWIGRLFVDFWIGQVIIGPALVAFWRGIWDYSLFYLDERYAPDCSTPNILAMSFGLSLSLLLQTVQTLIKNFAFDKSRNSLIRNSISATFSVAFGAADIFWWKGLWDGINCWIGHSWKEALGTMITGSTVLGLLGVMRSCISAPLAIAIDEDDNKCSSFTYFDKRSDERFHIRALDVAFTLGVEGFVILFWHGLWTLEDIISDHQNWTNETSAWISTLAGTILGLILFAVQFPLLLLTYSDSIGTPIKNISGFIFGLMGSVAAVTSFRGYWYLLDEYFIASNYELSLLNSQTYGAMILLLCGLGCTMHPGIVRDRPGKGDCTLLSIFYYTHFWIQTYRASEAADGEDEQSRLKRVDSKSTTYNSIALK